MTIATATSDGLPSARLVVLRGGSSTGKTRAAWEAVAAQLPGWQLDYPRDPAALRERLDAGVPAGTVLWLGELRQYAEADGGAEVLGRLADLLHGEGCLIVTTVWPAQWNAYVAAARPGAGSPGAEATAAMVSSSVSIFRSTHAGREAYRPRCFLRSRRAAAPLLQSFVALRFTNHLSDEGAEAFLRVNGMESRDGGKLSL